MFCMLKLDVGYTGKAHVEPDEGTFWHGYPVIVLYTVYSFITFSEKLSECYRQLGLDYFYLHHLHLHPSDAVNNEV